MALATNNHKKGDSQVVKWSERDPQKIRHKGKKHDF